MLSGWWSFVALIASRCVLVIGYGLTRTPIEWSRHYEKAEIDRRHCVISRDHRHRSHCPTLCDSRELLWEFGVRDLHRLKVL